MREDSAKNNSMMQLGWMVVILSVVAWGAHASLYLDFVQCVEQKQCGLSSVCSFSLASTNKTTISGYIMRIANGLGISVNITWDILGNSTLPAPVTFELEAHNSRFINTHQQGVHTIRLQINTATADTEIANPEFTCTNEQACEYLVRSCFANNDDYMCKDYASYCQSALKYTNSNIDTFRQACIPNCIAEFYSGTISDPYRYKSDEIINSMLIGYYQKVSTDTSAPVGSSSPLSMGATVTIIVLAAALLIIIVVAIVIYIQYRRGRIGRV